MNNNNNNNNHKDYYTSDYFNIVIGYIEDFVISDEFQILQHNFMEKYYKEFDESEENKLIYMDIFNEYTTTIETFIVDNLKQCMEVFDMDIFSKELITMKKQLDGEIFELLYSLNDFVTFKEIILDYKNSKEGMYVDMSTGITIKRLTDEEAAESIG